MSNTADILIVEESISQAEQLKRILEQHNHQVSVERNGKLALASMRQRKPKIVISAIQMSKMDGYELCRKIKAEEGLKDIPVILLTSLSDAKDIIRGLECGADNFITKPYDEELLLSRIEYILLNRELRVDAGTQTGLEIVFGGEKYSITPGRQQMADLLISTYETAVHKNHELLRVQDELRALNERLEDEVQERTTGLGEQITGRAAAEEASRGSEDRYRRLVELSPHMIAIHCDGHFVYVNAAGVKLLGAASSADLIGTPFLDIIHPDYRELVLDRVRQNLAGKQTPLSEQKIIRFDGQIIDVEVAGISTTHHDKPAVQLIIRDITERKATEQSLKESESRYRTLVTSSAQMVWYANATGEVQFGRSLWQDLTGQSDDEVIGMGWLDALLPESREQTARLWQQAVETKNFYEDEQHVRTRDGGYRIFHVRGTPVFDEHGQVREWVGTHTDITERKQAEQALFESEERLRQSQKMEAIGTLAGGIAHDFNNLLTAILGNTQLVLSKLPLGDPTQLRLVEVEKAGNRAAVLTRQLLAFSRRQILERRTLNVNETISEIVKLLQRIIGEDVEVRLKTDPTLSAVFADPAQIEQVVMNLGVNARDAMPKGGQLTIETSNVELDESYHRQHLYVQPGRYVEIRVSDTGKGMDEETQARIFEPFFTTKQAGKGTGLGLSMVYGIIKQHDGLINVYSEVGHGTTFKVFLPVDEKAVEQEMQALQIPLSGGKETILVAEDEVALRNLAKLVLEGLGYTVLLAQNGKEAVEMYEGNRERIDLVLFDVVMPHLGGSEAYQQIRKRGSRVPLLLMTGYSSETVQSRFVKENKFIQDLDPMIIQKPYSVEGLGRKVREVLDRARQN